MKKQIKKFSLDFDSEFKKLIAYEKNRQLNQFSTIYFQMTKELKTQILVLTPKINLKRIY
jgi:hypothetical protein